MAAETGLPVEAVLFDLDDTLYEQAEWLEGAWRAVARAGAATVDETAFLAGLRRVAAEGSDRGRIIDRALAALGRPDVPVAPLVEAFRRFRQGRLTPYPGVERYLANLGAAVPLALVTDGDPPLQAAKLAALGLAGRFAVVVYCDELGGRSARKPAMAPFLAALEALGVTASRAVYVGDRPDKDVAGATAAGMRAVRVLTGEYRDAANEPAPWLTLASVSELAAALGPLLRGDRRRATDSPRDGGGLPE
ncbi:MAG: HAD family hydrolase [Acidimicrobiales bacterium]|jgi:putative hydrolase of the HAD superfamily